MRNKLLRLGAQAMEAHELLELLLYHVIPQKNTNPIAHALLNRFGSLEGVFTATAEQLCEVEGVGERVARMLLANGAAAERLAAAPSWEQPGIRYDDYKRLGAYLVSYFEKYGEQATVAVLLDANLQLIATAEVARLDFGSAGVRAAGIVCHAVKLGASAVVLAHNHPHGPTYPTHADIVSLGLIDRELASSGVFLLEHYIVCGKSFVGFHKRFPSDLPMGDAVHRFLRSKEETAI